MSLVIAKIIGGRIRIESDSQLSNPNDLRQNPITTVLKAVIVTPRIVVCFAGDIKAAHDGLNEVISLLKKEPNTSADELSSVLLNKHLKYANEVDFILAASEVNNLQLYKISMGKIKQGADSEWIGDQDGFSLFQSLCNNNQYDQPDDEVRSKQFTKAFSNLISSRTIPSIGGFQISVASQRKSRLFKYLNAGQLNTPTQTVLSGTFPQVSFGDAAAGGYALSKFTSSENDIPAIALHFAQINVGVLYLPTYSLDEIRVDGLNGAEFVENVSKTYGIKLSGIMVDLEKNRIINIGDTEVLVEYTQSSVPLLRWY